METTIKRTQTALRIDNVLLQELKRKAKKDHRSLNNFIEKILLDYVERPNAETIKAINDAKNGIGLKDCDTSSLEAFINSMKE